jgi:hypothetical protein
MSRFAAGFGYRVSEKETVIARAKPVAIYNFLNSET